MNVYNENGECRKFGKIESMGVTAVTNYGEGFDSNYDVIDSIYGYFNYTFTEDVYVEPLGALRLTRIE